MALFLSRHRRKRITRQAQCPAGPSPLQQIEPAFPISTPNKQAGQTRRPSQGSATSRTNESLRRSISSSSSESRRDSGTAFLSRITLSPDLQYWVTDLKPIDNLPVNVEHDTCEELYRTNGNYISLRLNRFPRNEQPSKYSNKYLSIPLQLLDYDRNDKVAAQCIRARDYVDCRVDVKFKLFPQTETAVVYSKPVLSVDGGKAWANCPGTFTVIDYIEEEAPPRRQHPLKLHGKFRLGGKAFGDLWEVWMRGAYVDMDDFEAGEGHQEIDEYVRAQDGGRSLLRQWIKAKRLVLRDVRVNTLGRPIAGTLDLLGKVYDDSVFWW